LSFFHIKPYSVSVLFFFNYFHHSNKTVKP